MAAADERPPPAEEAPRKGGPDQTDHASSQGETTSRGLANLVRSLAVEDRVWALDVLATAMRDERLRDFVLDVDASIRLQVHSDTVPWSRIAREFRIVADMIDRHSGFDVGEVAA